jgi:hypothetical protein
LRGLPFSVHWEGESAARHGDQCELLTVKGCVHIDAGGGFGRYQNDEQDDGDQDERRGDEYDWSVRVTP